MTIGIHLEPLNSLAELMTPMPSVLIFSPFFFPESISTGRYNTHLAEALSRAGCDVSVICSHPFYPEWIVKPAVGEVPFPVDILRAGNSMKYPKSQVLRRFLLEVWFLYHAVRSSYDLRKEAVDVVIDIYPPNLFALVAGRSGRKSTQVIGIVHDLQGLMSQAKSSFFRKLIGKLIRPMEKAVLRRADKLIFLSNGMRQFAIEHYGVEVGRSTVVYPFITLPKISARDLKVPDALSPTGKSLVYSGALGEKQVPERLYELLNAFAMRNPDFSVHIFSNGPIFNDLKAASEALGSTVSFSDLVPSEELAGLLHASTIQIVPQKLGFSDGAFPSKLPNLIASNTAILGITDEGSELDQILLAYTKGASQYSWSLNENLAALELLSKDLQAFGDISPADEALRSQFDVDILVKDILGEVALPETSF